MKYCQYCLVAFLWLTVCGTPLSGQSLTYAPSLRLDGARHQFTSIRGVVVDRAGRIGIIESGGTSVRVFSEAGVELAPIGRSGEGPGEFRSIGHHGLIGDTVWVNDNRLRRTAFLTLDGVVLRTSRWPANVLDANGGPLAGVGAPIPWAMEHDGSILAPVFLPQGVGRGLVPGDTARRVLAHLTREGKWLNTVATLSFSTENGCSVSWTRGTSSGGFLIPFCSTQLTAVALNGATIAVIDPAPPVDGKLRATVRLKNIRGQTLLTRDLSSAPVRVPPRVADSARKAQLTGPRPASLSSYPPEAVRAVERMKIPDHYPQFSAAAAGTDSTVWLKRFDSREVAEWIVLGGRHGAESVNVALPAKFILRIAGRNGLWGVEYDEDGVPSVIKLVRQ